MRASRKCSGSMRRSCHHAPPDAMRQRILWALSMSDLCPSVIKEIGKVSDSKLSQHLRLLKDAEPMRSRHTRSQQTCSAAALGESAFEVRERSGGLIGRRERFSYLSGMASIVSRRLDLRLAAKQVVNLFPAVMVRVHHSSHLSSEDL
ncbi:MAG: ArsR family transcriptional regulator [Thermoplasmata archaeon]